ncbi:MAG: hypothetical protein WC277_02035 [Bacilli bacterium]
MIPEVRTSIDVVENPNVSPSLQEGSVSVQINGVGVGLAAALATAMEETARRVINEQNGREVLKAFLPTACLVGRATLKAPPAPSRVYPSDEVLALIERREDTKVIRVPSGERFGVYVRPASPVGEDTYNYGGDGPVHILIVKRRGEQ